MKKIFFVCLLFIAICTDCFTQCNIIYAAPDTTGSGTTMNDPASIEYAFSMATEGTIIRLCTGTYYIDSALVIPAYEVIIEGGFDFKNKTKTSEAGATTIHRTSENLEGVKNAYRLVALKADSLTGFEIHDLTISTADMDASGINAVSTYGIHISNSSDYAIVRTMILPGSASNGANGTAGDGGEDGQDGQDGQDGAGTASGGAGGLGGNRYINSDTWGGGHGGKGGYGLMSWGVGTHGGWGYELGRRAPLLPGGRGGQPGVFSGENGGDGKESEKSGVWGRNGGNGSPPWFGKYYLPGGQGYNGREGGTGTCGGGGGGGGGACPVVPLSGGGGGGGGSFGWGGKGGTGARGGGSSFGIYAYKNGSNCRMQDCIIIPGAKGNAGIPGMGGVGGKGGMGGKGGAGNGTAGDGGDGGDGSDGGNGGRGGYSYDGVSIPVKVVSDSAISLINSIEDLMLQPIISITYTTCTYDSITCISHVENDGWDLGSGSILTNPEKDTITGMYYNAGFKSISTGTGGQYSDFVLIPCMATFTKSSIAACDSYTWSEEDGNTYTTSGSYFTESINQDGCKHIDTLSLTINTVDATVLQLGNELIVNESGALCQWLDCDDSYSLITGEVNQSFIAAENGNFAVAVTKNGCTDTSACFSINTISINQFRTENSSPVYPNPSTGKFIIDISNQTSTNLQVFSSRGELILESKNLAKGKNEFYLDDIEPGIYLIKIYGTSGSSIQKLIVVD